MMSTIQVSQSTKPRNKQPLKKEILSLKENGKYLGPNLQN
jgi:hypothetical protein